MSSFASPFHDSSRNPVIGGEKLDLPHLYFLVTQQGGIEKVVLDGKWREVVARLNISHTITNRSFMVNNLRQVMPLLRQPVFNQGSESSGPDSQLRDSLPEDGSGHATSGDLPSDPTLGVDAPNVAQSAPSIVVDNGDAALSFVALSPSFRENTPIGVQSFPTNVPAHGIGENMPAGGWSVHNNLLTGNIGPQILHGVQQSQPFPAANFLFSFFSASTSAAQPQPCSSAYHLLFEGNFSTIRNITSQSTRKFASLIEESWGGLTEADRGAYN